MLSLSVYYTHEKGSSSSICSSSSSANLPFTEFMIFLRNSSFLALPGSFVVIPQTRNEFSIISGWFFYKVIQTNKNDRCHERKTEPPRWGAQKNQQ